MDIIFTDRTPAHSQIEDATVVSPSLNQSPTDVDSGSQRRAPPRFWCKGCTTVRPRTNYEDKNAFQMYNSQKHLIQIYYEVSRNLNSALP